MSGLNLTNHDANTRLYVKYMVSLRCKKIVKSEIENLGLKHKLSLHGLLKFTEEISESQAEKLKSRLQKSGMILLSENESLIIEKIINTIIEVIHYTDSLPKIEFTDLLDKHVIAGEESILKIFSDVMGMSVLQFIVLQKIERAKELLLYDDKTLPEIAEILNYKNEHYLLAQFKKTTGLDPSYFKRLKQQREAIKQGLN